MGSCPRVLHVSFSCFLRFSLVLDPGGLRGKVERNCEEFENNECDILGLSGVGLVAR